MKRRPTSLFNGKLARGIVILFLVHAGIDILNPQLCNDEFTPGPVALAWAQAPTPVTPAIKPITSSEDRKQLPSEPHNEEDCFCCCTHVLPGVTTHPTGLSDLTSVQPAPSQMPVASTDREQPYHPPRFI